MQIDLEELERRLQLRGKAAWKSSELERLRMSADIADAVPALIAEVRRLRALLDASEESARLHYESAEQVRSEAQNAIDALRAEVRRLRARPGVHSASFMDLHFPVNVSIVDVLEEAPKALGYQITTDESHEVKLRAGQPRLGTIVTLVHEMLHVAESASGIGVPHQYIAMSSVGAVLALARCGVLGADDAEIADFIEYMKTCESVDGEDEDEAPELLDPIEECERLMTENERLRAEVERRPDISSEDVAAIHECSMTLPTYLVESPAIDAMRRAVEALRAHAAKVKPQCSCSRRLGDYCPDVDRACPLHGDAAKVKP